MGQHGPYWPFGVKPGHLEPCGGNMGQYVFPYDSGANMCSHRIHGALGFQQISSLMLPRAEHSPISVGGPITSPHL